MMMTKKNLSNSILSSSFLREIDERFHRGNNRNFSFTSSTEMSFEKDIRFIVKRLDYHCLSRKIYTIYSSEKEEEEDYIIIQA